MGRTIDINPGDIFRDNKNPEITRLVVGPGSEEFCDSLNCSVNGDEIKVLDLPGSFPITRIGETIKHLSPEKVEELFVKYFQEKKRKDPDSSLLEEIHRTAFSLPRRVNLP